MPSPHKGESKEDFMGRCMDDPEAKQTFEEIDQRVAFCESQWDRKDKENAVKQLQIRANGDTAEVLLYDIIGADPFFGLGVSAKTFREQVKALKVKNLSLRINSPGGDVFEATAMMTALDEFKGRVVADVDGLAASAASYLIMAADEVRLGQNAMMMIHEPYSGVLGGAAEMRARADVLDKVKGQILDAYERKSKAGRDQLAAWMAAETWFTGQEAVDAGLADSVTAPVRVAALAQNGPLLAKFGYKHVPELPKDAAAWEATRKRQAIAARLLGPVLAFTHNSKVADSEPDWGGVDKTALPMLAFADHGDGEHHSTFGYPHHWVQDAGGKDDAGVYTTGTLYLHQGGLNAAWSAAQGGRSGKKASPAVIAHLEAHRKALGLEDS